MKLPRPRIPKPLDGDDQAALARIAVYSLLVLWVALIAGLAIRLFLLAGFA